MPTKVNTQDIADGAIAASKMSVLTTKGDLLGFGSSHSRIPVGANGQILGADNSVPMGVRWQNPSRTLYCNTSIPSDNTVSATSSETNFASYFNVGANFLTSGVPLFLRASGTLTTGATSSIGLKIKLGTTTLASVSAVSLLTGLSSARAWSLDFTLLPLTIGTSASLECYGHCLLPLLGLTVGDVATKVFTAALPTIVDTTAANNLQLAATWGPSLLGNSITLRQFLVSA